MRVPVTVKVCAVILFCVVSAIVSPAQTFTNLLSFTGPNGASPESIVQGPDGNLWGATANGGLPNCGIVFKMSAAGVLTRVVSFNCTNINEGQGLILGTDGNLYGNTFWGAGNEGTVFRVKPGGAFTVLASFDGSDGQEPVGSLTEGPDGNFYGATYSGGSNGWGTIFKVTPSGTLNALYNFDFTNGSQPYAGPVAGRDGNLYGTNYSGDFGGCGGVFKLTLKGAITVLHSFNCTSDGSAPVVSLAQGTDGNFYGTAINGGSSNGGTVFKITPSGAFTVLHSFAGPEGQNPASALIQATDGNFYGTTASGGANGAGTVFKMTATGVLTDLHDFDGTDGAQPIGLVQDTNGTIYGIAAGGGTSGEGTIFSLAVGLGPFVKTLPTIGKVGTNVIIIGTNLKGATSVSFNGVAATFTVVSSSEITATVPTGATTGKVQVKTPNRTLSSNVSFRVTK